MGVIEISYPKADCNYIQFFLLVDALRVYAIPMSTIRELLKYDPDSKLRSKGIIVHCIFTSTSADIRIDSQTDTEIINIRIIDS